MSNSLNTHLINARIADRHREPSAIRSSSDHGSTSRFLLHYVEMVAVMFAGMFVLMSATGPVVSWSALSPAMYTFAMAMTMTLPMVAWMRFRGHSWRANLEMAASMLIPTFLVIGVQLAGAKGDLTIPEHAGMLSCMLVAMLLRRDEYSCSHHGHQAAQPALAS